MKLTIQERLVALQLLPKQGDFTTLGLIRKAREALSFTEEEHKQFKFRKDGEQISWTESGVEVRIDLGEVVAQQIQEHLEKLNTDKQLREEHYSIYEKFIEGG